MESGGVKGTGKGSTKVKKTDSLYKRSSFRKGTRVKAESEAPKNASGKMICPTCGKDIPGSITINTKNGWISSERCCGTVGILPETKNTGRTIPACLRPGPS